MPAFSGCRTAQHGASYYVLAHRARRPNTQKPTVVTTRGLPPSQQICISAEAAGIAGAGDPTTGRHRYINNDNTPLPRLRRPPPATAARNQCTAARSKVAPSHPMCKPYWPFPSLTCAVYICSRSFPLPPAPPPVLSPANAPALPTAPAPSAATRCSGPPSGIGCCAASWCAAPQPPPGCRRGCQ